MRKHINKENLTGNKVDVEENKEMEKAFKILLKKKSTKGEFVNVRDEESHK